MHQVCAGRDPSDGRAGSARRSPEGPAVPSGLLLGSAFPPGPDRCGFPLPWTCPGNRAWIPSPPPLQPAIPKGKASGGWNAPPFHPGKSPTDLSVPRFSNTLWFVFLKASPTGLEPVTYCLGGSRSIHLSYGDGMSILQPFSNSNLPPSWCSPRGVYVSAYAPPDVIASPSIHRHSFRPQT